jgi:hypothetical protein
VVAITKTLGFERINPRGIVLSLVVLFFVLALFFIPEIIDFQRSLRTKRPQSTATVLEIPVSQPRTTTDSRPQESALDKLLGIFSRGSNERVNSQPRALSLGRVDRQVETAPATTSAFSWTNIKGRTSQTALRKAYASALEISKSLPATKLHSKYALYNLASGIRLVISGGESRFSADEAYRYLSYLDGEVTRAMTAEKVDVAVFNSWRSASLGSVFERARSEFGQGIGEVAFNPQLRVLAVRVQQPANTEDKWIEGGRSYLHLAASVKGTDSRKVTIFRNGEYVGERRLPQPGRDGSRTFAVRGKEARGVYTFVITDRLGRRFEKSYGFYNRARDYSWQPRKSGRFALPFASGDPRLDTLFALNNGRVTRSSSDIFGGGADNAQFTKF